MMDRADLKKNKVASEHQEAGFAKFFKKLALINPNSKIFANLYFAINPDGLCVSKYTNMSSVFNSPTRRVCNAYFLLLHPSSGAC